MTVLETNQLTLRQAEESDAANLLGFFTDPRIMRFHPVIKDDAAVNAWIRAQQDSYQQHGHGIWVASLKDSGEIVGVCGLAAPETESQQEVEISYSFRRCLWGRGLAEEAAHSCREYGSARFGYTRFVTLIGTSGVATRRVAERLGMTLAMQKMRENQPVSMYAVETI